MYECVQDIDDVGTKADLSGAYDGECKAASLPLHKSSKYRLRPLLYAKL